MLLLWRNRPKPDRCGNGGGVANEVDDFRDDSALYEDEPYSGMQCSKGDRGQARTRGNCGSFDISRPPAARSFVQSTYGLEGGAIHQPPYEVGPSRYCAYAYTATALKQHGAATRVCGSYRYGMPSDALHREYETSRSPKDGRLGVQKSSVGSKQIDTLQGTLERARADVGALFAAHDFRCFSSHQFGIGLRFGP